MAIEITNVTQSTIIVQVVLLAVFLFSFVKPDSSKLFPPSAGQELKGLSILVIVAAHISYMLVTDHTFLTPLHTGSGCAVDIFLFLSGYGLSVSMLRKPLPALEFYKRRLIRVFVPFWIVSIGLFAADAFFLNLHYPLSYRIQSILGWFPKTRPYEDVNSPFWYITWMMMFYAFFPLLFNKNKLWITAILLSVLANLIAITNPFQMDTNWWHRMHTDAFSLGVLLAWALRDKGDGQNVLVTQLTQFRDGLVGIKRYALITVLSVFAVYIVSHGEVGDWLATAHLLDRIGIVSATHVIGETTSLLAMMALIVVFSLKRLDNRFLYLLGTYSYEIYLLHWPLMYRYDVFFQMFPAWLATLAWLGVLLAMGWCLRKISLSIA